jgi:hypothetical protein
VKTIRISLTGTNETLAGWLSEVVDHEVDDETFEKLFGESAQDCTVQVFIFPREGKGSYFGDCELQYEETPE